MENNLIRDELDARLVVNEMYNNIVNIAHQVLNIYKETLSLVEDDNSLKEDHLLAEVIHTAVVKKIIEMEEEYNVNR